MTPEELARRFHDEYERLAPSFGYETRPDTKAFDPTTPNGKLMMAVCKTVCSAYAAEQVAAEREACAELCDAEWNGDSDTLGYTNACNDLAEAIRSRAQGGMR